MKRTLFSVQREQQGMLSKDKRKRSRRGRYLHYTTTGCNIVLYFRLGVLISTMTPSLILSHRVLVAIKHRVVASMAKTDSETYHAVLKKIMSAPRVKEARRESRKTGQSVRQKTEERTVKGQMRRGRYKEMKEEQSFKGFHITHCVRTTYWRRKQGSDERERERERERRDAFVDCSLAGASISSTPSFLWHTVWNAALLFCDPLSFLPFWSL